MRILLKDCNIIDPVKDYAEYSDILIDNGKIINIGNNLDDHADKVMNLNGLTLVPGFIDMHCHLREPGYEYKETVKTGTEAAAKGGFTTICCMPNTLPVIDSPDTLMVLKKIIDQDALIGVYPIGAITKNQHGKELVDINDMVSNGVKLFSDDGVPVWDDTIMEECLRYSKDKDIIIIDHCEDLDLVAGGVINKGKVSERLGLKGISNSSETQPIIRNIKLAEKLGAAVHIAHISTEDSLEVIKKAKKRGVKISCEVTPHHISLCDEDIKGKDTSYKVNPPLRNISDVKALQQGIRDGYINIIATDHAPHNDKDKPNDFIKAANGISGFETAFSVCFTYLVRSGLINLKELLKLMCLNPAKLLNIDKGRIHIGNVADLTVIDLEKSYFVNRDSFVSKGKNTPYHGKELWGEIVMTIYEGNIVYRKEGFKCL